MAGRKSKPNRAGASRAIKQTGLTDEIVEQWLSEMPGVDPLTLSIGAVVTRLSILNEKFLAAICKELGVSTGGMRLLYALRRVGPPYTRRPTDLYQLLAVTSGAVSYTIGLLARQNLIEMFEDPQDGRGRLIRLTDKGRRLADAAVARGAERTSLARAGLTPDEERTIVEVLRKLAGCWERLVESDETA